MAGEIQALKKKIIQIVTSTIGSDSEPADYVLSLFSDPGKSQIDNKKGTIHDTGQFISNYAITNSMSGPDKIRP